MGRARGPWRHRRAARPADRAAGSPDHGVRPARSAHHALGVAAHPPAPGDGGAQGLFRRGVAGVAATGVVCRGRGDRGRAQRRHAAAGAAGRRGASARAPPRPPPPADLPRPPGGPPPGPRGPVGRAPPRPAAPRVAAPALAPAASAAPGSAIPGAAIPGAAIPGSAIPGTPLPPALLIPPAANGGSHRPGPADVSQEFRPGEHAPGGHAPGGNGTQARHAAPGGEQGSAWAHRTEKIYVVKPPAGRFHESLWEIAENHLGDGRRYREIFELNAGRPQPDGSVLTIASLIRPGWVLRMPHDAYGPGIEEVKASPPARHSRPPAAPPPPRRPPRPPQPPPGPPGAAPVVVPRAAAAGRAGPRAPAPGRARRAGLGRPGPAARAGPHRAGPRGAIPRLPRR